MARAKPAGGGKRPGPQTVRVQLHLGGDVFRRLGVHAALVQRDKSALASEILDAWLRRYGQGRALWSDSTDPVNPDSGGIGGEMSG